MKKNFTIMTMVGILILTSTYLAKANASDVAISEVVFDPAGIDTGLEYIIVTNFGNSEIDMTGWDLYPGGVGYFTFPNFLLGVGKSVKVLLHTNGTNNESTLYHFAATGNMANSSGSVAIFSSTSHTKNSIASFVRYHRIGSVENKTWESIATSTGLWTAGSFVDVSKVAEGGRLILKDYLQKTSAQGWAIELSKENTTPKNKNAVFTKTKASQKQSTAPLSGESSSFENNFVASEAEGKDKKTFSGFLWLFFGVTIGAVVGCIFLVLKKLVARN